MLQVYDIWTDFVTGATNTAIQYETNERLALPTMTFCPKVPFKAKERGLEVESYMENSFQLRNIFEDASMANLSNSGLFSISEVIRTGVTVPKWLYFAILTVIQKRNIQ
jgi:hypothetical protein